MFIIVPVNVYVSGHLQLNQSEEDSTDEKAEISEMSRQFLSLKHFRRKEKYDLSSTKKYDMSPTPPPQTQNKGAPNSSFGWISARMAAGLKLDLID